MKPVTGPLTPAEKCLLAAAQAGNAREAKRALERGADINAIDKHKASALVYAAAGGHRSLVGLLLQEGADVNLKGRGGNTALSFAAFNGHVEIVRELLKAGSKVNATIMTPAGKVPVLVYAAADGYREVVELFLKHGATLNPKKADVLPLNMAAGRTNLEMVRYLISAGADVNARQELRGYSALMEAACTSSVEMIRLLVKAGADVNARDKIGMTALMFAARRGDADIVKELLVSGADAEIAYENPNGRRTALEMARECDRPKVARLLDSRRIVQPWT